MPDGKTYKTPQALRTALEARLLEVARRTGTDLQRRRRRVAFDRLLARMFSEKQDRPAWYLKGGYAIELRIEMARTTKDIDLSIAAREPITAESLHRMVDSAASLDLADGFVFLVGESILVLDAAPQGGSRFPVQAQATSCFTPTRSSKGKPMKLTLDHTQRLNLHALLGAQRADVGSIRAIWAVQDRIALNTDEEKAVELKREIVAGQERAVWNPARSIPAKEFEFTDPEVARMKAALQTWDSYGANADRRWLQPLVETPFAAEL